MMSVHFSEVIRGLRKNRLTTLINISGFVFSMAVCMTIFLFVKNKLNYDKNFKSSDKAYRILRDISSEEKNYSSPRLAAPYKKAFSLELGEAAEQVFRVYRSDELVKFQNKAFIENDFFYVDEGFFSLWDFEFVHGSREGVLNLPDAIVISTEMARKYFGNENPLGQIIALQGGQSFTVRGVIRAGDKPSHFKYNFIASMAVMEKLPFTKDWDAHTMNLYIVMKDYHSEEDMKSLAADITQKYLSDQNADMQFRFQKFHEIYFDTSVEFDQAAHGQKVFVFAFMAIGILIVIIAIANFINLSMIQFNLRLKSIGMKKILGSTRKQLIYASISESAVIIVISLLIACGIHLALKSNLTEKYQLSFSELLSGPNILMLVTFSVVVILISSFYPALTTARVKPLMVIRNQFATGPRAVIFRRTLLSFQFFCTTLLIIVSMVMFQQLYLVRNTPLGFNKERVVVFHSNNREVYRNRTKIKDQLSRIPGVRSAALMYGGVPGSPHPILTYQSTEGEKFQWHTALIDENFSNVLELRYEVVDSAWTANQLNHGQIVLLNATAVREMGWKISEALGKRIKVLEKGIPAERRVVGVVKDYYFQSLKNNLQPLALIPMAEWAETFAVRLATDNFQSSLSEIEKVWIGVAPDYPFTYNFLDSSFDESYQKESNQLNLFILFTIVSVVLSCLGLIGLSGLVVHQKRKELGIRSVLGASLLNIVLLLSREFMIIVAISGLLAYPVAYLINSKWIASFTVQVASSPLLYLTASLILLFLIVVITLIQSLRAGISNPANYLRTE